MSNRWDRHDQDADSGSDDGDDTPVQWVSPASYPTRCTDDLALRIAERVRRGTTLTTAALVEGVLPSRLRDWLKWGEEAYHHDADENDYHWSYLNLILKVGQAVGLARSPIEQRLHRESYQWWLTHHPEARGDWGGTGELAQVALPAPEDYVDATANATATALDAVSAPVASTDDLRFALRTVIEAGAAVPPPDDDEPDQQPDEHPHGETRNGDGNGNEQREAMG